MDPFNGFAQVSDVLHVASTLKDPAAQVGDLQSSSASSVSHSAESKLNFSEIWTSIYSSYFTKSTQVSFIKI